MMMIMGDGGEQSMGFITGSPAFRNRHRVVAHRIKTTLRIVQPLNDETYTASSSSSQSRG